MLITPYHSFQDARLHSNPMATGTGKRLTSAINLNHSLNGVIVSRAFFAKLASNPQPGPSQFPIKMKHNPKLHSAAIATRVLNQRRPNSILEERKLKVI